MTMTTEILTLDENGELVQEIETAATALAIGQIVTYEDRANPFREFVIVGPVKASQWTASGTMRAVCLEDGHETQVRDAGTDGHAGFQIGNRILGAAELAQAIMQAGENKTRIEDERAAAAQVEKQRQDAERIKWASEFSYLQTTGDGKTQPHALGAKNIKKELSRAFPGVKFSAKSNSYSGGNSIDVSWDLGPTADAVDKIISKYQEGSFDGMTDSYDYDRANQWPEIYGGAKYVHSARHCPEKITEQISRGLCALQRIEYAGQWTRNLCGENDDRDLGQHVHQLFCKTAWPVGAELDRVESSRTAQSFEFQKAMHAKYGAGWLQSSNLTKYNAGELAGIETLQAEWSAHWCKVVFKSSSDNQPPKDDKPEVSPTPAPVEPLPLVIPAPVADESKILAAAVLGTASFNAGKKRIPALDLELLALLEGNEIGEGHATLAAWLKAWDDANLAAPVIAAAPLARNGAAQKPAAVLIRELKEAGEDREFYPTTNEIIATLCRCIGLKDADGRRPRGKHSVLDIGAGNGKVLNAVKERCGIDDLHAIEKSPILCAQLDKDIMIVGTDFNEQSLLSKKVDVIFCNPPYSDFEAWAEKIIRQAASKVVFLVLPVRWEKSLRIADALKFRQVTARTVGKFDFEDAEDRRARAVVHLIRVDFFTDSHSERDAEDAFDRSFEEQFADLLNKFKASEARPDGEKAERDGGEKADHAFTGLVAGPNYPAAIVELYNQEMANIHRNYKLVAQLDVSLLKEFSIEPKTILKCLKARLSGLKKDYWMELFSRLDSITSRLTSQSRKQLLERLHHHVDVDFTVSNILEIVLWVIKNANSYIDSQLISVYEKMVDKCNVQLYKSNQKTWVENGWRYGQGDTFNTHFALDYRIVTHRIGGINAEFSGCKLDQRACEFIADLRTIARNLGFQSPTHFDGRLDHWERNTWQAGSLEQFALASGELLFDVRAFKNGNLHLRLKQDFILALNVEHGRLKGWLRNAQEAAEELQDQKAAQYFNGNQRIEAGSGFAMLGDASV